jgi:hypothetical protein
MTGSKSGQYNGPSSSLPPRTSTAYANFVHLLVCRVGEGGSGIGLGGRGGGRRRGKEGGEEEEGMKP